ncbi:MAG: hypothetical protein Q4G69_11740 [Planctomycetia bacterium]|nr:hypothetical protein [Planctomycetia bacterium]
MTLWMGYPPMYLIGIPVACMAILAFCRNDSLWGSIIKLFNVFFASLIAINFFEPVANLFDSFMGSFAYYNDMLSFFFIFAIALGSFVEITNRLSRFNIFFPEKVNLFGTYATLFILFVFFYGITAFTFTVIMPEAPRKAGSDYNYPPQFNLLQYVSKMPLAPLSKEKNEFDTKKFLTDQDSRNVAVYISQFREQNWQFKGDKSPNLQ